MSWWIHGSFSCFIYEVLYFSKISNYGSGWTESGHFKPSLCHLHDNIISALIEQAAPSSPDNNNTWVEIISRTPHVFGELMYLLQE